MNSYNLLNYLVKQRLLTNSTFDLILNGAWLAQVICL